MEDLHTLKNVSSKLPPKEVNCLVNYYVTQVITKVVIPIQEAQSTSSDKQKRGTSKKHHHYKCEPPPQKRSPQSPPGTMHRHHAQMHVRTCAHTKKQSKAPPSSQTPPANDVELTCAPKRRTGRQTTRARCSATHARPRPRAPQTTTPRPLVEGRRPLLSSATCRSRSAERAARAFAAAAGGAAPDHACSADASAVRAEAATPRRGSGRVKSGLRTRTAPEPSASR